MKFFFHFHLALVEIIWNRGTVSVRVHTKRERESEENEKESESKWATILANLICVKASNKNETPTLQSRQKNGLYANSVFVVHILCTYARKWMNERTKGKGEGENVCVRKSQRERERATVKYSVAKKYVYEFLNIPGA